MKRKNIFLVLTLFVWVFISCEKEFMENSIFDENQSSIVLNEEFHGTTATISAGFDEWGFNYTAHLFDGYLINAMLGDPSFQGMPHYRQKLYKGEGMAFWDELVAEYPYFIYILPDPYLIHTKMQMKWNEALLSESGVYPPTWVDSGAWIEFKYTMDTEEQKWRQSRKLVGVSSKHHLVNGYWFDDSGKEVGKQSYHWPELMIIQVENQGDNPFIPHIMPGDYKSPNGSGYGKYK